MDDAKTVQALLAGAGITEPVTAWRTRERARDGAINTGAALFANGRRIAALDTDAAALAVQAAVNLALGLSPLTITCHAGAEVTAADLADLERRVLAKIPGLAREAVSDGVRRGRVR